MPGLSENGKLLIPLYHGTSSLFSESIVKFGLGSINPLEQFSVMSFMKSLYDITETMRSNDENWLDSKLIVQWMLDQNVFDGGANFQHGQTYLTPCRSSAVGYALSNQFGSELLTQAQRLFSWLMENNANLLSEKRLDRHPATNLFLRNPEPILITAHRVNLSQLLAENGGPVEPLMEMLSQSLEFFKAPAGEILMRSDVVLNFNFRLKSALNPGAVELSYLDSRHEKNPYNY